eukprot:5719952-Pleurochrysis_carterae.AAC.3
MASLSTFVSAVIAVVTALPAGASEPAYILTAGDTYAAEPVPLTAAARYRTLAATTTFADFEDVHGFLLDYPAFAWGAFGRA